jgi:hypothetical protein
MATTTTTPRKRPSSSSEERASLLLMDDDPLPPRNYDAATHARRLSQLRQEQQGSTRTLGTRRASLLAQQRPSVLKLVLDDVDSNDKKQKKKKKVATTKTARRGGENQLRPQQQQRPHSYLYSMLNPLSHKRQAIWFKRIITTIILLDLLCFIVSTDPTIGVESDHIVGRLFFQVRSIIVAVLNDFPLSLATWLHTTTCEEIARMTKTFPRCTSVSLFFRYLILRPKRPVSGSTRKASCRLSFLSNTCSDS